MRSCHAHQAVLVEVRLQDVHQFVFILILFGHAYALLLFYRVFLWRSPQDHPASRKNEGPHQAGPSLQTTA